MIMCDHPIASLIIESIYEEKSEHKHYVTVRCNQCGSEIELEYEEVN
jgi:hypothetical protein